MMGEWEGLFGHLVEIREIKLVIFVVKQKGSTGYQQLLKNGVILELFGYTRVPFVYFFIVSNDNVSEQRLNKNLCSVYLDILKRNTFVLAVVYLVYMVWYYMIWYTWG